MLGLLQNVLGNVLSVNKIYNNILNHDLEGNYI